MLQNPASSPISPESALSIAQQKAALRERIRLMRREQSPGLGRARSREAQQRLINAPCWQEARSVALYVALKEELSTEKLLEAAWQSERAVWLPRVSKQGGGRMDFVRCTGMDQLRPGPLGLREPLDSLPGMGVDAVGTGLQLDLLVLPGLAFDRRGSRLGFGGGYYDRFLGGGGLTCPRVGLCFAFQLFKELPVEGWDEAVQFLCTEEDFLCL